MGRLGFETQYGWSKADHIRTVELVAQVVAKQTGRNHQWHIQVGLLMRLGAKQTFIL